WAECPRCVWPVLIWLATSRRCVDGVGGATSAYQRVIVSAQLDRLFPSEVKKLRASSASAAIHLWYACPCDWRGSTYVSERSTSPILVIECFAHAGEQGWDSAMDDISQRNSAARPEASGGAGHEPVLSSEVKTINLALQGGGAHGAFTWGVLDRLLDEKDLAFEGLSATSAGAMNAAVFAYGLAVDGREGARKALAGFWKRVSDAAKLGPLQPNPIDRMLGDHKLTWSPVFSLIGFVTRMLSPYQFNPVDYNPLRDVVEQSIDFDVLKRPDCPVKLFLSATNVRSGKVKIFTGTDISLSAVMASACLPTMFHAVEIDGEAYWDGGYMGNPALFPLIYNCTSTDSVIVHINPLFRIDVPHTADDILNRINEISFNSS